MLEIIGFIVLVGLGGYFLYGGVVMTIMCRVFGSSKPSDYIYCMLVTGIGGGLMYAAYVNAPFTIVSKLG